jgi:hypothetical protein
MHALSQAALHLAHGMHAAIVPGAPNQDRMTAEGFG